MDKEPIAVDDAYEIRDNQFWYNNCKFRSLIEGKNSIEVKIIPKLDIKDIGEFKEFDKVRDLSRTPQTFYHSNKGKDGRITLSYTIPYELQEVWNYLNHHIARVELRNVQ
ncbi:hypothetical protein V7O61_08015 [Methanolobus sp. WCC1]|uniref:hypothetical protein n=1 Tax=unclassified Methanolobus TaxID=2629569 RepID=UPI003251F276